MYYKKGVPEYAAWRAMKQRCSNPKHKYFYRYGGRGITVCREWVESFDAFYADMGAKPSSSSSLDRIDNDRGYSPDNCRWTTHTSQCRNRSTNKMLEYKGEIRCLQEWAEIYSIGKRTLRERIQRGWDVHLALTTPVHTHIAKSTSHENSINHKRIIRRRHACF